MTSRLPRESAVTAETIGQLRALAAEGDSYAAFKSAALACGLTPGEAEEIWAAAREDAELREGEEAWLTSTEFVNLEAYR